MIYETNDPSPASAYMKLLVAAERGKYLAARRHQIIRDAMRHTFKEGETDAEQSFKRHYWGTWTDTNPWAKDAYIEAFNLALIDKAAQNALLADIR